MDAVRRYREFLPESRRIVVKIGTRVIEGKSGSPDAAAIRALVGQAAGLRRDGYELLLVTSGAVGAGMDALGLKSRPAAVPDLQMCAAVGQARLMTLYERLFAEEKITAGQILLTHATFRNRLRFENAKRTMEHMLRLGVVPVINENDAVADEEIRAALAFADNDHLAALVVKLVRADLLVILSTVAGVLDAAGARVPCFERFRDALALVNPAVGGRGISKGGMASKLRAARIAVRGGCGAVIADGRAAGVLTDVVAGRDVGTLFPGSAL